MCAIFSGVVFQPEILGGRLYLFIYLFIYYSLLHVFCYITWVDTKTYMAHVCVCVCVCVSLGYFLLLIDLS
jgi:hypothetical protein